VDDTIDGTMTPFDELAARVDALVARGGRVLGIAGPPGSGKSTLAERLVAHFGERAALLPMDGFHYAQEELQRLGRAHRKGAPDTFDVDGYVATLARVRAREHDVLVPRFHRDIEEPIAGAIRIDTGCTLVVTDGNYLLLPSHGWHAVAPLLDECWFLQPDDDIRIARLVARHEAHGRSPAQARAWVRDVDEPNARVVAAHPGPAHLVVDPG
jgi:pantothenate kinase